MDYYAEMRLAIGKEISEKEATLKVASNLIGRNFEAEEFARAKTVSMCEWCIRVAGRFLDTLGTKKEH